MSSVRVTVVQPEPRVRIETGFTADGVGRGKTGWTFTLSDGSKIRFAANDLEDAMDRALLSAQVNYDRWRRGEVSKLPNARSGERL